MPRSCCVRTIGVDQLGGSPERLVGDTHHGLRAGDVVGVEGQPVGFVRVGVVGGGIADVRPQNEQAGSIGDGLGGVERCFECVEVVGDFTEFQHVPAVAAEPGRNVVVIGDLCGAVDRDVVVVVDGDQLAEPEVAGQRGRLVGDALHQAAVAGDHVGVMVDRLGAELVAKDPFGDRHSDGVGEALSERPGGDFDAGGVAGLRVARCCRFPLPERLEVIECEPEPGEVQHRVLQASMRARLTTRNGRGRPRRGRQGRTSSPG